MYKSIEAKETVPKTHRQQGFIRKKMRFEKKLEWFYYLANALTVTLKLFSINIMICKFHTNKKATV